MKTTTVLLLLSFVLPHAAVSAIPTVSTSSAKATVTQAASAVEQIAQAQRLLTQMRQTPAPQKFDLFAQAWANLSLVRKAWPTDKAAVVHSGVLQADLAAEFGLWPKVIDVLTEILPAAANTAMEPAMEKKLGIAYDRTANVLEAEKHLLAAERSMRVRHLNRVESEDILRTVALFYARQHKPGDSISRFREAEMLPGQDIVNRSEFQLAVAEQAVLLGKDAATQELARFDDLVSAARRMQLTPADATLIDHLALHAQRLRDGSHR